MHIFLQQCLTALHTAASLLCNTEVIELLLRFNADVTITDGHGKTPAEVTGNSKIARLLRTPAEKEQAQQEALRREQERQATILREQERQEALRQEQVVQKAIHQEQARQSNYCFFL